MAMLLLVFAEGESVMKLWSGLQKMCAACRSNCSASVRSAHVFELLRLSVHQFV